MRQLTDVDTIDYKNKIYTVVYERNNKITLYKLLVLKNPEKEQYKAAFVPISGGYVVNDNISKLQYMEPLDFIQYVKTVIGSMVAMFLKGEFVLSVLEFENNDEFFGWLSTIHREK